MLYSIVRKILLVSFFLHLSTYSAYAVVFDPTSFTLDNGLEVVVVPNHLAPVVNQMVWYKVGSADEVAGKTGLAHYLEHLMFRGTANIEPDQFSRIVAAHGGEDNAFTSYDYTAFFETVSASNLPMIMQMEADRMQNLRIVSTTATPELSVVLNERQQRTDNNPEGRFVEKLRATLMPSHPYGIPVIGWKREIEKFSVVDATQFYERHYAPNNAVVIISGDVTPEDVRSLAASTYGLVLRHDVAERLPLPTPTRPQHKSLTMVDVGVEQPQYTRESVVPSYSTEKNHEAYAYEVLNEVLDGSEVGFLYHKLVIEKGIASGVGVDYDPDARGDAIFTIGVTPRSRQDPKGLQKIVQKELTILARDGLDQKLVDDAKNRLKRSAIFARDNLMMPGYAFGMALSTGHKVNDVEEWPDRINGVTVEQVNAALRALVINPNTVCGLLLPDPHASARAREAAHPVLGHDVGIR